MVSFTQTGRHKSKRARVAQAQVSAPGGGAEMPKHVPPAWPPAPRVLPQRGKEDLGGWGRLEPATPRHLGPCAGVLEAEELGPGVATLVAPPSQPGGRLAHLALGSSLCNLCYGLNSRTLRPTRPNPKGSAWTLNFRRSADPLRQPSVTVLNRPGSSESLACGGGRGRRRPWSLRLHVQGPCRGRSPGWGSCVLSGSHKGV